MVTPCYYPVIGGTETIVRNLTRTLNENGIHVDILSFNVDQNRNPEWRGKTEMIDGITVFKIPAINLQSIARSPKITLGVNFIPGRFIHILKDYDVLHFHEADLSFPLFSFLLKKPKIIHLHGIDYAFLKRYYITRFLLERLAHLYIVISKKMKKELLMLGFPEHKIVYLPNGIDTNLFAPSNQKEDNMVLFIGRISPGKNLHLVIESLHYLNENVRLIIIGPFGWNIKYNKEIMYLIEKENRKGRHEIKYLGSMGQAELVKWYQKATLLVLPSSMEGFPVTILEALACETPVIATPVGGIPEIVKNYKTGILIPHNAYNLAKAIQFLLNNKNDRLRMGFEGRRLVLRQYSLKAISKKLSAIYAHLCC
jgi:glycosyltransferase involved in cell wall biosynthesis